VVGNPLKVKKGGKKKTGEAEPITVFCGHRDKKEVFCRERGVFSLIREEKEHLYKRKGGKAWKAGKMPLCSEKGGGGEKYAYNEREKHDWQGSKEKKDASV